MATDDVLCVGVVGISKHREARGRSLFAWPSFSSSIDILLRYTEFSKSLSRSVRFCVKTMIFSGALNDNGTLAFQ